MAARPSPPLPSSPVVPGRRRLPAGQRRAQMLDIAMLLVKGEGVAGLTLARLAEASGVSKPIAYQHFGTREGLLSALYARLGQEHEAAANDAIAAGQKGQMSRGAVASAISAAFIDCVLDNGRLYTEIAAALAASGEAHQNERIDFARRYAAALAQFGDEESEDNYGFSLAFLGAGESLAAAVLRGDMGRSGAIETLRHLLLAMPRKGESAALPSGAERSL